MNIDITVDVYVEGNCVTGKDLARIDMHLFGEPISG